MGGKGGDGGGDMYVPPTPTYSVDPATGWMIDSSGDVYEGSGSNISRYVGRRNELAELGGTPRQKPEAVQFDPGTAPVYTPPGGGGKPPPTSQGLPSPMATAGGGTLPPDLGSRLGQVWTGRRS